MKTQNNATIVFLLGLLGLLFSACGDDTDFIFKGFEDILIAFDRPSMSIVASGEYTGPANKLQADLYERPSSGPEIKRETQVEEERDGDSEQVTVNWRLSYILSALPQTPVEFRLHLETTSEYTVDVVFVLNPDATIDVLQGLAESGSTTPQDGDDSGSKTSETVEESGGESSEESGGEEIAEVTFSLFVHEAVLESAIVSIEGGEGFGDLFETGTADSSGFEGLWLYEQEFLLLVFEQGSTGSIFELSPASSVTALAVLNDISGQTLVPLNPGAEGDQSFLYAIPAGKPDTQEGPRVRIELR